MPPLGVLIGGVDFSALSVVIQEATEASEAVTIKYGAFIQTCVDFLIVAFAIFMAVKVMNSLKKEEEVVEEAPAEPEAPPADIALLTEIRDLLKREA